MPNTTPIPELIAEELVTRLQAITIANGYQFDIAEVVRPNRSGDSWNFLHMGVGVIQASDEVSEELSHPGNPPAEGHVLTFAIHCISRESKDSTDAHATNTNLMVASVKKAIQSVDSWYTFDGNAVNAEMGAVTPFSPQEGEFMGATVPLVVHYRISETNPFEVRA